MGVHGKLILFALTIMAASCGAPNSNERTESETASAQESSETDGVEIQLTTDQKLAIRLYSRCTGLSYINLEIMGSFSYSKAIEACNTLSKARFLSGINQYAEPADI